MDQNRDIYPDAKSELPHTPTKKLRVVQSATSKAQKSHVAYSNMIVNNQSIIGNIAKTS